MSYMTMKPVDVWESGSARRRLADVEAATNFLLIKWLTGFMDTRLHRAAQVAAMYAMNGDIESEHFRAAFEAAAREADVLAD